MSAQWPRVEAESTEILDAAHRALRNDADRSLTAALDRFVYLRKYLADKEEENRLSERERAMLRNSLIAEADTLREMNQLEAAADAYRAVSLRYMNEPPALRGDLWSIAVHERNGPVPRSRSTDPTSGNRLATYTRRVGRSIRENHKIRSSGWEKLLTWMNGRINSASLQTARNFR